MLRKVGKPPLALRLMSQRSRVLSITHMSIGLENKAIESVSVFYKGVPTLYLFDTPQQPPILDLMITFLFQFFLMTTHLFYRYKNKQPFCSPSFQL